MSVYGYVARLRRVAPGVASRLRPPADPAEIVALERRLGRHLPEPVREAYLVHDGQSDTLAVGVVYGLEWLPLDVVGRVWSDWADVRAGWTAPARPTPPGAGVYADYTRAGWIPLFRWPHGSDYFGVDLDPAPAGRVGQVINFGRNEDEKYVAAEGLPQFFALLGRWLDVEAVGSGPVTEVAQDAQERRVENLFGNGSIVFNRLHPRRGPRFPLVPADVPGWSPPPAGPVALPDDPALRRVCDALVDEVLDQLPDVIGRSSDLVQLSTEAGPAGTPSLISCSVRERTAPEGQDFDRGSWIATGPELDDVLDRLGELGQPARLDVVFTRVGDTWSATWRALGAAPSRR